MKQISTLIIMMFLIGVTAPQFAKAQQTASDYFAAGLAHSNAGQYFDAIQDYDKAIALNPDYALALSNRSIVNRLLGKISQAENDCRIAKQIDSSVSC